MLEVVKRKQDMVESVCRKENSLFLQTAKGMLRLKPQSSQIVRVTYTMREEMKGACGIGILEDKNWDKWEYEEQEDSVILYTEEIALEINKNTGSLRYLERGGRLLLAEREENSRELVEFDSYKTVVDENTKIEEVETPDGIKRVIKEASTVFDKKLYHTYLHLKWQESEHLYGLGQAEEGLLNLRGTVQYLHQANLKIAIPFLLSSNGYGVLLSTGSTAVFQDTQYGSYLYTEADEEMDYYFIAGGSMDEVVKGYRFLTGKAVMLPRWAYGFIQSQERYETQEEILEIAGEFRKRGFGLDALVLDWCSWESGMWGQKSFDKSRFPQPKQMTDALHDMNVHFMISIWPNMNKRTANYEEFLDKGLLLPASEIYDAFRKEARELYWKQANDGLFCQGIDAWWCDSSEPFTPEWSRKVKPGPEEMYASFVRDAEKYISAEQINSYGLLHAKTIYEGQRKTTEEKRVANLTRNGYVGSQRYGTILWSGDIYASWETLRRQIAAGLNFCASGLPYWTLDIGAFFVKKGEPWFWNGSYDEGLADLGYRELFVRWFQYGAFLPVFRSHGTDVRREPWLFESKEAGFYEALRDAAALRYRLLPYIYSWAYKVWKEDKTFLRMLAFDFGKDETALDVDDEFMFGESILVCPVTKPMYYEAGSRILENVPKTRSVYLPAGCDWYDFYTGERFFGGQFIEAEAPLSHIPVYVRAGSILPMVNGAASTADAAEKKTEYHVYPGTDSGFALYQDSGDGYGYEKGEYTLTELCWKEAEKTLYADGRKQNESVIVHGMQENRM